MCHGSASGHDSAHFGHLNITSLGSGQAKRSRGRCLCWRRVSCRCVCQDPHPLRSAHSAVRVLAARPLDARASCELCMVCTWFGLCFGLAWFGQCFAFRRCMRLAFGRCMRRRHVPSMVSPPFSIPCLSSSFSPLPPFLPSSLPSFLPSSPPPPLPLSWSQWTAA